VQRARLLDAVMADIYGERTLLACGLLPASLVLAHPQYLRAMHGCRPAGGVHLHVVAFDLTRCADGPWWVVGQRTQAPSGLGCAGEPPHHRPAVPEAFRQMAVQRLAASYRDFIQALMRLSPAGERSRVALLTPGPRNETYFEQAFLARYLGITLVEGADLTVRGDKVPEDAAGLERVHGCCAAWTTQLAGPAGAAPRLHAGRAGLLQAVRAGEVVVANAPGAGWLESPGLGLLARRGRAPAGRELAAGQHRWWCGEASAWRTHRAELQSSSSCPPSRPAPPRAALRPSSRPSSARRGWPSWRARIDADPTAYTLQARLRPTKQPVWTRRAGAARGGAARLALTDGRGGWQVLPGG
jgi:uncharacterized circularly permuted ATP-grasp superfamily protein